MSTLFQQSQCTAMLLRLYFLGSIVVLLSTLPSSLSQNLQPSIFLNAGSTNFFTDFQGNDWEGDEFTKYFSPSNKGAVSAAIDGTFEDVIYQSDRWSSGVAGFGYDIPVANGSYEVILHFAEVYLKGQYVGSRVFNVSLEGEVVFPFVDIFGEVGGFAALTKKATTTVRDEVLSLHFHKIVQNPKICGIEIHPIYVPSVFINAGGPSYIDNDGNVWVADIITNYFDVGISNQYSGLVDDTPNELLFHSERRLPSKAKKMVYAIPVLNGIYDLSLYFAETYGKAQKVGARVFNVAVEGKVVFEEVDIYKEVGGYKPLTLSTTVTVTDGFLTIEFERIKQNPKICAIEIHPEGRLLTSSDKTLEPVYINAGSSDSFKDSYGKTWKPDDFFNTGLVSRKPGVSISGAGIGDRSTSDVDLYQSNRWDPDGFPVLTYNIPASDGDYTVTLHFAETYSKANFVGYRVFDVKIEEKVVFENVDVFAEVGLNAAMSKTTTATVSDGALTIQFLRVSENPFVSGIEIHPNLLMAPRPEAPKFNPIRINAGSTVSYTDVNNKTWSMDAYFGGGKTLTDDIKREIDSTGDDPLYHTERWSPEAFTYEIPLPDGSFEVTLHFAELYSKAQEPGKRIFDVKIEGNLVLDDFDIYQEAGNGNTTVIKAFATDISDGALTLEFIPGLQNPKVNAIEVVAIGEIKVHQAHAVPGGPYIATDTDNDGMETVLVDGKFSHTHGPGARLVIFNWIRGNEVIGFGEQAELKLLVGVHNVSLEVRDSSGDVQSDWTIITVRPFGFPEVASASPTSGDIAGGDLITIVGLGFNFTAADTTVHFGEVSVRGAPGIKIVDNSTIQVIAPRGIISGQQELSVETPIGKSNPVAFVYIDGEMVTFEKHDLFLVGEGPTTLAWGPDGRLYVGTQAGGIIRLTLNETSNEVIESETLVSRVVSVSEPPYRVIMGMAFDPMDTSEYPAVYVSHSFPFHKQELENSYNGKISKVSGERLDKLEHVITGLPVSDHDHGINGIEFGNDGEMYFQIGGNTNAGVPGYISSRAQLDEGYFSAATIVAYLNRPNFDGKITYDKDGFPVTSSGVEVFATGQRNSYDICLHSNGELYATDNGPNFGYGSVSTSCDTAGDDPKLADKLNHIVKSGYYGHANRLRGKLDPRQCVWRNGETEKSDDYFTAPMLVLQASSDGIIEYESEHFGGQLRGRLIIARYLGELWTVALSEDGKSAITDEVLLSEHGGLDVAMGPDGKLYVAQNGQKRLIYLNPLELPDRDLVVKSVFPRRGPQAGGSLLQVHGKNLNSFGIPTVTVGGQNCPVKDITSTRIRCTLPSGSGPADIIVTAGKQRSTFTRGYRFISVGLKQTRASSPSPSPSPMAQPKPDRTPATTNTSRTIAGVSRLVLVDAATEKDVKGYFDCSPCVGFPAFFNVRADTVGDVAIVAFKLNGPIKEDNIVYSPPFSIFGYLNGNYAGRAMMSGSYSITAQAMNDEGVKIGPLLSAEFTISGIRR